MKLTRELLNKYLQDRCTPEELAFLRICLEKGGGMELNRILEEDWAKAAGTDGKEGAAKERIWERLAENTRAGEVLPLREAHRKPGGVFRMGMAAAVVLCLAVAAVFIFWKNENLTSGGLLTQGTGMVERKNEADTLMTLFLSDGSRVILEPRSTLRFPEKFEKGRRLVSLVGKAFFEVTKDSLNPFFVKTNSLNVKVLGTSFNVTSFEDRPAEVSVLTGRVAVSVAGREESLILKPNERVVCMDKTARLQKMLVAEPVLVRPEVLHNPFDFDEAPVADVFGVLEKAYNIRIVFDRAALKHCTLKARLDDQPLFVKLEMICTSMGLAYRVSGTTILITGAGC